MELVELTKKILPFESVSYKELELVQFISQLLNKHSIPHIVDYFSPKDFDENNQDIKTANIYVDCVSGSEALMIYSHLDVVDGKKEQFIPFVKDNKLFARGTSDMKSALASQIFVLINNFKKLNESNKKIIFSFISDEEHSGTGIKNISEVLR